MFVSCHKKLKSLFKKISALRRLKNSLALGEGINNQMTKSPMIAALLRSKSPHTSNVVNVRLTVVVDETMVEVEVPRKIIIVLSGRPIEIRIQKAPDVRRILI